jgi:hypothetical protein
MNMMIETNDPTKTCGSNGSSMDRPIERKQLWLHNLMIVWITIEKKAPEGTIQAAFGVG